MPKYQAKYRCKNCGTKAKTEFPAGKTIAESPCPNCGCLGVLEPDIIGVRKTSTS